MNLKQFIRNKMGGYDPVRSMHHTSVTSNRANESLIYTMWNLVEQKTKPLKRRTRRMGSFTLALVIIFIFSMVSLILHLIFGVNLFETFSRVFLGDGGEYLISNMDYASSKDVAFHYGCHDVAEYQSMPGYKKQNAAFVMLTQNDELDDVLKTMESIESKFNQWYKYPYVFLNDKPFSEEFQSTIKQYTAAEVEFGVIDPEHWDFPDHLEKPDGKDNSFFENHIRAQEDRGILYGGMKSYHKMCRFYSGFFYKHPIVSKYEWYWRIEPDVEFFCSITYDPFYEMKKNNKKYGFTIMINELYWTVPSLFRETQVFLEEYKSKIDKNFQLGSAWSLLVDNYQFLNVEKTPDHEILDVFINSEEDITDELSSFVEKNHFGANLKKYEELISNGASKTKALQNSHVEAGIDAIINQGLKKPTIFEDKFANEEYNTCHFWSNFEIARVDTFDNPLYNAYFEHLEKKGGFYKERWGDAAVHSLGVAMLDLQDLHYFRDIGYRHSDLVHCPYNKKGNQKPLVNDPKFESTYLLRFQNNPFKQQLRKSFSSSSSGGVFFNTNLKQIVNKVFSPNVLSKETDSGPGCRCECPFMSSEIEDVATQCSERLFYMMSDDYEPHTAVDSKFILNQVEANYLEYLAN